MIVNFNSHAHVERDVNTTLPVTNNQISTHTLTWSVTIQISTLSLEPKNFNSHAHVERDEMGLGKISDIKHFNSHAHVERDALKFYNDKTTLISTHTLTWSVTYGTPHYTLPFFISTHTLTWSVTRYYHIISAEVEFQLTRSRGA